MATICATLQSYALNAISNVSNSRNAPPKKLIMSNFSLKSSFSGKSDALQPLAFKTNQLVSRNKLTIKAEKASTENEVVLDEKILPYCDISKGQKKTIGEMEQEFLLALQSFYVGQDPIMSNEEFDNLKENLMWEGSAVVILSTAEQKFMEASLAFAAGKPFLTDKEYDDLKLTLKKQNSKVAIEGPRCSLRSRKVYSDLSVDYLKMTLLNLPAALIALTLVFFLDDLSGFEITYLLELPEPYSFLFTWFIVLPIVYLITQFGTNLVLKNFLILKGPCPSCGTSNGSFFGSIFSIENNTKNNVLKCENCGSTLDYNIDTRMITLVDLKSPGEAKPEKPNPKPKAASKKA